MLKRRQFLVNAGKGVMLLGLGPVWGCTSAPAQATQRRLGVRTERWANTICQLCPSACGLRIRIVDGNPVMVAGNPLHPVNRGGLCARGATSLQLYYDPDRISGPQRRDHTTQGWAPVSWEDGIEELARRLASASTAGPGRVAVIRGDGQDIGSQLLGRLARAMGSDWVVDVTSPGERASEETVRRLHGAQGRLVYDLAGTDFLFSFESGLLESPARMMSLHRDFADMRTAGGYCVHAGPRMGVTGAKADAWLPMLPSGAGVLALGIAHMLIREGYARDQFLRDHVEGFDDRVDEFDVRHVGIRSWILREFSPERVAQRTGIEAGQVIRVARQFGSARRPLAIGPLEAVTTVSVFDLMAVHALNSIVGSIDEPGGVLWARQPPFDPLDGVSAQDVASPSADGRASSSIETFADWVLGSRTTPIDVVFVHDADPVFSSERGDRVEEALRRIPFVVSTSPVINDTVQTAHLVLPQSLWLERRCDVSTVGRNAYPVVSLCAQAVEPRAEVRNIADVILTVAGTLGDPVARQFPWQSYNDVVMQHVDALFTSGEGDAFSAPDRSAWMQMLEHNGWRTPSYHTSQELEQHMEAQGGWWDPVYHRGEWRRIVRPRDHRINLEPLRAVFRPDLLQPPAAPQDGELLLYVYPEIALATRTSASLPYLQDLGSPLSQKGWQTSAEINPVTAARFGIKHGDHVNIQSPRGTLQAVATLCHGVRPDVVAVHTGGGHLHGGRYAAQIGANPLRLLTTYDDDDAPRVHVQSTFVRVNPVG